MSRKPSTTTGHRAVQKRHDERERTDPLYRAVVGALRQAINDHKRPIDNGLIPSTAKRICGQLKDLRMREAARRLPPSDAFIVNDLVADGLPEADAEFLVREQGRQRCAGADCPRCGALPCYETEEPVGSSPPDRETRT